MTQVNAEANELLAPALDCASSRGDGRSEDTDRIDDVAIDNVRLVPVGQSIHYRKRAQAAEQKLQELSEQLRSAQSQAETLTRKINQLQTEQALTCKLIAAGANDVETALLVARSRLSGKDGADLSAVADVDGIVEQLRTDKAYLFGPAMGLTVPDGKANDAGAAAPRTTCAKDRLASGQSSLEKAAKRAATTGSRADLQDYLRVRRNFV